MIARHKLIEAMIRNNELQLKNESARGGAEIDRECALRDVARRNCAVRQAELEQVTARLQALQDETRSAWWPSASGSIPHCSNSKVINPTATNKDRDMRDEQDREQRRRQRGRREADRHPRRRPS